MFLDAGIRVIGAIYNSPTVILTKKPAPKLEDIKGLKVRTFASPLQIEPMKSIGAIPVPLALTEVIPQLQSGGIDGMLAGMPILTAFKYYDVAKYVTDLQLRADHLGQRRQRELVQGAAEGRAGRDPRRRPRGRAEGVPLGRREHQEVERALARQQGRDPEAAGGGAGGDDEVVRRHRHQDRGADPGGEGGVRDSCKALVEAKQPK